MAPVMTKSPAGDDIVILSRAEYEALTADREDADDAGAARNVLARFDAGTEQTLTEADVDALLAAPTPLAFWRAPSAGCRSPASLGSWAYPKASCPRSRAARSPATSARFASSPAR
jgi:hypothetical protein